MLNRFFFIVLLILLMTVGCDQATEVTSVPQEETLLELASTSQFLAVMAIQDRHTDRLLAISGAVGTATGLTEDGRPAIVVFITTEALAKSAPIPVSIEEVPVIIKVTGMFVALTDPTTRQSRPVPIGVSTGHPDITAGTIGARVTDGTNVFALSNNHVYANINEATLGDNVLQPGSFDGGIDPEDAIGTLSDFEPILFDGSDNIIDAAIATSSTDLLGNSTPTDDGYGTPNKATVSATLNQAVKKYGRTTGLTTGKVVGVNGTFNVCYKSRGPFKCNSNFIAKFVKQIVIEPGGFSSGGDSGSLIVTNDGSNNPVGLLFAGNSTHTIANPIDSVLFRFDVTIDDSEPVAPGAADAATSTITTSPTSITADGTSESTITVQLKDADGNNLTTGGEGVALSTNLGTIGAVTDNGDGTYSATLTAGTTAGTATVTGRLNEVSITDAATVTFTEPVAADATTSTITASSTSITADGTSASTITVQLKDANGNNLTTGGEGVALNTDLGIVGAVTDNGDGTYTATLTAGTTAGTATVKGTLNGEPMTDTATVTFTETAAGVTVTFHDPPSTQSGDKPIPVTVDGSGFEIGAKVTYENGSGPAPKATVISVTSTQITAETTLKAGGPPRDRFWDVRVTNPDGSTGVLVVGFTVTP